MGNCWEQDLGAKQGRNQCHRRNPLDTSISSPGASKHHLFQDQPVLGHGLTFGTTTSPQLLGRMKGWSCFNKILVFFFLAEGCPISVSVCTRQATRCLASSFGGCVPGPQPQAELDPAPSRVQLSNPDGSSAGCCDPDHVPSPTLAM